MFETAHTTPAADGTEISYYDTGGDQPAVVLVHGITEQAATWGPVAEALASTHRVVALDLRGHGASGTAASYDLEAMAGDVIAVISAAGLTSPQLVGHSLGGVVASAVGAVYPVASVVCVDQALNLAAFQDGLLPVAPMLRDPAAFPAVIEQLFAELAGPLAGAERERVDGLRRPDQTVVLGIWDLILTSELSEIAATVDAALEPFSGSTVPYLAIFGIDPGDEYSGWLSDRIPTSVVETWADHGHYPHLVDPERFLSRVREFWA